MINLPQDVEDKLVELFTKIAFTKLEPDEWVSARIEFDNLVNANTKTRSEGYDVFIYISEKAGEAFDAGRTI